MTTAPGEPEPDGDVGAPAQHSSATAPDAHVPASSWATVEEARGLLPADQQWVTLADWQSWPTLRWSFQHMREIMPSHVIDAAEHPRALSQARQDLGEVETGRDDLRTLEEVLAATETDAFLVLHRGRVVEERYLGEMTPRRRHLLMSMSKSIVSCVTASLAADGVLDPEAPVEDYVPELASSGYADASVRHLLDMRSGIRFSEAYLDPESEVRLMERSMGWAPRHPGDPVGMYPFILSTERERDHGGVFEYRSIDTDALGWICERASGTRMADLVSQRVWVPLGARHDAEVSVDALGSAVHDGGISATLGDLGRFGQMLLDDGRVGDRVVVPDDWLASVRNPSADVREAFAASANEPYLPGGWYRNQFWCVPGDHGPIIMCLGIHGQMVFVEPATGVVGVKLSAWPVPQDAQRLVSTIDAFRAVGRALA